MRPSRIIERSSTERRARTLHLVDIENLLGIDPKAAPLHDVRYGFGLYARAAEKRNADQIIVGCNPELAYSVADTLRGSGLIRVRLGKDGADLVLLESVDVNRRSDRYDRVVLSLIHI